MTIPSRRIGTIGVLCAVVLIAGITASVAAAANGPTADRPELRDFATIVDAWPDSYTVTATKSEPGYVEHITTSRDGDAFALRIALEAQGSNAGGTSLATVQVGADGAVRWTSGCAAADCEDDQTLRGFLATASVLSAAREGRLPATAVIRRLGDHEVACVADGDLFPGATSRAQLDPCFSVQTGAVLGHYSDVNATFVGATMAPGSIAESGSPDTDLFTTPPQ